jgi:SPP1 family phage portal protein
VGEFMEATVMAQQNIPLGTLNLIDGKFGRKVIYTSVPTIDESNVVEVLTKALGFHRQNEINIDYLEKYYTGNQPILYRTKDVRGDICNKIVENHAYEFVEFQVGQECGEPIQYVRRGKDESVSEKVQKLNDYMASEDKSYWDVELSRWKHMVGTSYKICFPDKSADIKMDDCPFGIDVLRPQDTFVIYSSGLGKRPMMGVNRTLDENNNAIYHCYTKTMYFKIKGNEIIETVINGIGIVPIVEYPNNSRRLSTIEIIIWLFDAVNSVQSNRLDGIEQFIQAFLLFVNCQIDENTFLKMCKLGALTVKGEVGLPADVKSISDQLDQTQTQIVKKDLLDNAIAILGMPSREQNTGGDTGQAVYLRNGWDFAERRSEINEKPYEKSEKEFLRIALKILSTNGVLDLKLSDIDIKFTRSKTDNMVVKTQALLNQLNAGVNSQVALKTCELYPDPEDVYLKSKDVMDAKYGKGSITNPNPPTAPTKPLKEVV